MAKVERAYQTALAKVIAFPKTVILIAAGLFISSIFIFNSLGGEFIPALEEGDFAVDTRVLTGKQFTNYHWQYTKSSPYIKNTISEVEKVVTKIGSGEVPTDPMPMDAKWYDGDFKTKGGMDFAKTFNEMSEKMGKALQAVPGITAGFQFPVQMRFNELMTGARQDVVCKLFGEDLDTLAAYAHKLGSWLIQ